jgi:hypothetical protein
MTTRRRMVPMISMVTKGHLGQMNYTRRAKTLNLQGYPMTRQTWHLLQTKAMAMVGRRQVKKLVLQGRITLRP